MRILVAEDDPVVGDAFEEALRASHHTVFRTTGVDDTVGRLGDGEVEVVILDVQLKVNAIESHPGLGYRLTGGDRPPS